MNLLDEILRNYDLEYYGKGKHKVGIEKALLLVKEEKAFILDVRTREEVEMVKFGFAVNIPLNEIPDRLHEIPRDKTIAIFCVSGTRSSTVALYLQGKGYTDVKIIPESHSQITESIKPGSVLKYIKEAKDE